ncbi:ABC transporter ATP-binding protein [Lentibacillus saliphilus]|uniref:ABC transporter ATP-binding protein n=1 Tax=Lentibacillus saliphilus TaxID=2737028 RepID=UPI001C2F3402|nr:ABC transporter ATP-binding protein [Lentibacillus saliphilus]
MNAIELQHVSKKRKDFSIENMSFTVPTGYITGLIGPNGSGKTTTLHMLMDIIKADSGCIRLFGNPNEDATQKQRIGFVHDDLYMYEHFNIKKMKAFIAPLYNTWNEDVFQTYLQAFDLPLKKKLKTFSKGMKMKCSLLFALSHDPELIIMDEPTAGLDPVFRRELFGMLQQLMTETNRTILVSSHITSDLDRIADYVIFMNDGDLILNKSMDEISESFHIIKGRRQMIDADTKGLFSGIEITDVGFKALYEGDSNLFTDFGDDIVVEKATLEDIMFYLSKKRALGGMHHDAAYQA